LPNNELVVAILWMILRRLASYDGRVSIAELHDMHATATRQNAAVVM